MKDYRSFILKNNRKKLGYSLEALAHEICTPSYLSKLENDQLIASDEIYSLLLKKLNVSLAKPEEIACIKDEIDTFFTNFFSSNQNAKTIALDLLNKETTINNSTIYLYYQIFKLYTKNFGIQFKEEAIELTPYLDYLSGKEVFLYHLYLSLFDGVKSDILISDEIHINMLRAKGNSLLTNKQYIEAYDKYSEALIKSSKQGNLTLVCDGLLSLGYVCSFLDLQAAEHYYLCAIQVSNENYTKALAYYNLGSMRILNSTIDELAKQYLIKGVSICEDKELLDKFHQNLFIYSCLAKDHKQRNFYYEKIENKCSVFDLMSNDDYDQNKEYRETIKKEKDKNEIFRFLYIKNCITRKCYKEAMVEVKHCPPCWIEKILD